MITTRHVLSLCPRCGKELDASSHPQDSQPSPGDISVCAYCCAVLEYDSGLKLVATDLDSLPIELRIQVRRYIAALRSQGSPFRQDDPPAPS